MKRVALVALLTAVLAGSAVWLVGFSSVFAARSVEVQGTDLISEVTAAVNLGAETPLAQVDVGAIDARVRAIPQIADVVVRRVPPDRVVVEVTERVPVAVVSAPGGWQLLDASGTAYLTVAQRPALPEVRGGASPESAAAVAAALPESLRADVKDITASTLDDVSLTLRSGAQVMWGSAENSALKAQVLGALLRTNAAEYDVSAPATPTTTGRLRAAEGR